MLVVTFGLALAAMVAAVLYLGERREVRRVTAERDRIIERYTRDTDRLHVTIDDAHHDSIALQRQRDEQHAAEIERLNSIHMIALERLSNMQQFGAPVKTEGVISNPEPDAETRVINAITEDTIAAGVTALKREYEERGIPVSEEELRDEVRSMIMGVGLSTQTIAARTLPVKD